MESTIRPVDDTPSPLGDVAATPRGALKGQRTQHGLVFRGVRYAESVAGSHRFRPSRPKRAWDGIVPAVENGPIAPQNPSRLDLVMGSFSAPQDEDCLSLTIWTPGLEAARRPVLIWLHGGAYVTGAGTLDWYDGGMLSARGDIVVVSVNHRLGALGYLHDPSRPQATLAIEDQCLAIRWVYDNIRAFGGDPDCITLMGQSAGAVSIAHLVQDRPTAALVRRIILQSGGFGRPPLLEARAAAVRRAFMDRLRDGSEADEAALLAGATVERILAAQAVTLATFGGDLVFRPVSTGSQSADDFIAATAAACEDIDVVIGTTSEEGRAYATAVPPSFDDVRRDLDRLGDGEFERFRAKYPALSPALLAARFTTDNIFGQGTYKLALRLAESKRGCFSYIFDWSAPASRFGACHCIDLPFVFGRLDAWKDAPMLAGGDAGEMAGIARDIQDNWIGFVRSGTPADEDWARFDARSLTVRRFGTGRRFAAGEVVAACLPAG